MTLPRLSTHFALARPQSETRWGPTVEVAAAAAPPSSISRFAHLDMMHYGVTMPAADYMFFVTFAGSDTLGFTEDDFDLDNSYDFDDP